DAAVLVDLSLHPQADGVLLPLAVGALNRTSRIKLGVHLAHVDAVSRDGVPDQARRLPLPVVVASIRVLRLRGGVLVHVVLARLTHPKQQLVGSLIAERLVSHHPPPSARSVQSP